MLFNLITLQRKSYKLTYNTKNYQKKIFLNCEWTKVKKHLLTNIVTTETSLETGINMPTKIHKYLPTSIKLSFNKYKNIIGRLFLLPQIEFMSEATL